MRIAVLTTSYPRFPEDAAGRFVGDAVQHLRARGVEVEVVGPEQFRHFGIAYGHGIVGNLRRRPWRALLVPARLCESRACGATCGGRPPARAAVVVCPSRREGFGVACLEAMAHARPVVATGVGGLRDLVVDEETGLVVSPGDSTALRAALQRLLDDPALRRRLGAAGRERARSRFSWSAATDATLAVYSEAAGRMPG
jgi:Glycosyl transferases group 1